jgi:hypothetical protein
MEEHLKGHKDAERIYRNNFRHMTHLGGSPGQMSYLPPPSSLLALLEVHPQLLWCIKAAEIYKIHWKLRHLDFSAG